MVRTIIGDLNEKEPPAKHARPLDLATCQTVRNRCRGIFVFATPLTYHATPLILGGTYCARAAPTVAFSAILRRLLGLVSAV
jgi:hypothetical protein